MSPVVATTIRATREKRSSRWRDRCLVWRRRGLGVRRVRARLLCAVRRDLQDGWWDVVRVLWPGSLLPESQGFRPLVREAQDRVPEQPVAGDQGAEDHRAAVESTVTAGRAAAAGRRASSTGLCI